METVTGAAKRLARKHNFKVSLRWTLSHMKGHSDLSVVVYVVVWSACGETADGGRGLLLVVSCEEVLQMLAGLCDGRADHVMGEGKTS